MTSQQLSGAPQPSPAHDPQLTLAGVSRDGAQLHLVSRSGARFTLPINSRLTAALRGDTSIGQLEITMDSTIRPRDIQARIRAGETPEAVAKAASTTIDKIMPYAAPVLAEREHITERAQRSSLRRSGTATRTLGDAIGTHLRGLNLDPSTVAWDAWRREDGRWTLVADASAVGRPDTATFTFDAPGNFVVLEDDDAHWLVGAPGGSAETGPAPSAAEARRGLSAVPSADSGYEQPVEAFLDQEPGLDETEQRERAADAAALDDAGEDDEPNSPDNRDEPPVRRSARKKGGRASVPSWDEIMFGGGSSD